MSKVVLDSHIEEPEGLPIDLGSEINLSVDHAQGIAEYMIQDTFNTFISDDYAFKEEMQSTVNGLSLELRSIKELILNTVGGITTHILKSSNFANLYLINTN